MIEALSPKNDAQRGLQTQALQLAIEILKTRWLLFEQSGSSISTPFLVVLVFWLTIIFMSFGLFAPHNVTVVATLLVCALSVSGAIFLILELDRPFRRIDSHFERPGPKCPGASREVDASLDRKRVLPLTRAPRKSAHDVRRWQLRKRAQKWGE